MEKECPYCRENLTALNPFYLLHWCRDEEARSVSQGELYVDLHEFLETYSVISDQRKEQCFDKVWKNYNYQNINALPFSTYDMILSQEEVRTLTRFLEDPFQNENLPAVSGMVFESSMEEPGMELLRRNQKTQIREDRAVTRQKKEKRYFYERKKPDDLDDCQMDISYGTRDYIIIKLRRVCGNCYSLIPDEIYSGDVLKISLMAVPGSGKTSMLHSMFMNQISFNENNRNDMTWEFIQDASVDLFFRNFLKSAEAIKTSERKITPTEIQFIPPLFLKFYDHREEKARSVVLAIYDNSGEIFKRTEENKMAEHYAEIFNQRIRSMDALLCLVSPRDREQGESGQPWTSPEGIKNIRERSRIYTKEEQREIEENPLAVGGKKVEGILKNLSGNTDAESEDTKNILKNLEQLLGQTNMKEYIRDKYLALVVSRTDLLAHSDLFTEEEKALMFECSETTYFEEEELMRQVLREEKMIQMQKEHLLVDYDLSAFRTCSYHFVAAYVEEQEEFHPIRVEEPFIKIVDEYFRNL